MRLPPRHFHPFSAAAAERRVGGCGDRRRIDLPGAVHLDHGHRPSHLNGHQYIEMLPVVGRVVESLLEKFRIPVVRVAWEPSWWQSFTWPGMSTSQWLVGGLKKAYAGRFRQRMLGNRSSLPSVLGHDDRRHDVAGDNSCVSHRRTGFSACRNRLASRRQDGCDGERNGGLERPVGKSSATRTGVACLQRVGRTAGPERLPLGQAWPNRRSMPIVPGNHRLPRGADADQDDDDRHRGNEEAQKRLLAQPAEPHNGKSSSGRIGTKYRDWIPCRSRSPTACHVR